MVFVDMDVEEAGMALDVPSGLIGQLTGMVLERVLGAGLDDHVRNVDRAGYVNDVPVFSASPGGQT